jgi:glucose-6-phosphate isomerase
MTNLPDLKSVKALEENWKKISSTHLRNLLSDSARNEKLKLTFNDILFDYSHEKLDTETVKLLGELAEEIKLKERFAEMFKGDKINNTENRSVLHRALRMDKSQSLMVDNVDVVKQVHEVLDRIKNFSYKVRSGLFLGFTKKKLKNFISIGIGGSYLGVDFLYNAMKSHPDYEKLCHGFNLRFIANVCPIDFHRAVEDLNVEETLVIVVSKTFTTAETMKNGRNVRNWLIEEYKKKNPTLNQSDIDSIIAHHFCAVSTNLEETDKFGINKENVFGFWSWVGGRYSCWSAVGALPLSLYFSFEVFEQFLKGGKTIDDYVEKCTDVTQNIPMMLGLIGFYNAYICNLNSRAILPYSQALCRFPAHIQQLDMESNGKMVNNKTNQFTTYDCGAIIFGEPGTNGQHSFYQLIHQGRKLACEFIGYCLPQVDAFYAGEPISSHAELMCNFFAQPDALAYGRYTDEDLKDVPENLKNHKTFKGDRCSLSILFKQLDAHAIGELLAIYEHRVATEGFIYSINSFDQWGVELGKKLAIGVRDVFSMKDQKEAIEKAKTTMNSATVDMIKFFLENSK